MDCKHKNKIIIDDDIIEQALKWVIEMLSIGVRIDDDYITKNENNEDIKRIILEAEDLSTYAYDKMGNTYELDIQLPTICFNVKVKIKNIHMVYNNYDLYYDIYYSNESIDDILNNIYFHRIYGYKDKFIIKSKFEKYDESYYGIPYLRLYSCDLNELLNRPNFNSYKDKLFDIYKFVLKKYWSKYIEFNNK